MFDYQQQFIEFALRQQVLLFGSFTLKSGRNSPYFFNAGLFHSGMALQQLGQFYAAAITEASLDFDVLFGAAYKGIPLATATAIALAQRHQNVAISFNRKEVKDHGEGGQLIGAPLHGKILVIDDVISAGTAFREVQRLIAAQQATLAGVIVALDRQERGQGKLATTHEISQEFNIPVISIITLQHLIEYLTLWQHPLLSQLLNYQAQYAGLA